MPPSPPAPMVEVVSTMGEVMPSLTPVMSNLSFLWVNVVQKKKSFTKYDPKVSTQDGEWKDKLERSKVR